MKHYAFGLIAVLAACTSAGAGSIESAASVAKLADADGKAMVEDVISQLGAKPNAWVLLIQPDKQADDDAKLASQRKILDAVRAADSENPLIGCFTDTAVFAVRDGKNYTGDVMLVGLTGEGVEFKAALSVIEHPKKIEQAGQVLGEALKPDSGEGIMVLLTDSIVSHHAAYHLPSMFHAMQDALGPKVGIIGGNSAYNNRPVYYNDQIAKNALAGLMISGDIAFKIVQEPGKVAITEPLTITKIEEGNQIVEINTKPWYEVYKQELAGKVKPEDIDIAIEGKGDKYAWIWRRYPHALIKEHGQLYARLAHGLVPWGKGTNLPSESYDIKVGDKMVITEYAEDQMACISKGIERLGENVPAGQRLYMLFPCQSNVNIFQPFDNKTKRHMRQEFFQTIIDQTPEGSTTWGFMPCGEHASTYEPDKDQAVNEARYYQLSYPMSVVVAEDK